jgi:hypothetical protein
MEVELLSCFDEGLVEGEERDVEVTEERGSESFLTREDYEGRGGGGEE